jgi:hypothetical protein
VLPLTPRKSRASKLVVGSLLTVIPRRPYGFLPLSEKTPPGQSIQHPEERDSVAGHLLANESRGE